MDDQKTVDDKKLASLARAREALAKKRAAGLVKPNKAGATKPAAKKAVAKNTAAKPGKMSDKERRAKLAANLAKARKALALKRKAGLVGTRKAVVKAVTAKGNSLRALLEREAAALEAKAKAIREAAQLL